MINVLFVCLGNICRSPVAEGAFTSLVQSANLTKEFNIDSCGTAAYHTGEQPDPRMIKTAAKHGVKLNHKARQINMTDLDTYDVIIVMDNSNYRDVTNVCVTKEQRQKVTLLRKFNPVDSNNEVPDPYYGGSDGFENVFQMSYRSCENLLANLITSF